MKGFVFDLDNTLFDRYATLTEIMKKNEARVKKYLNPSYTIEQASDHLCHTESCYIFNGGWGRIYEALEEEKFFYPGEAPGKEKAFRFMREEFLKTAVNFPFTMELLKTLKDNGYKLGIITNGSVHMQNTKIDLLGIRDFFDVIVISGGYALEVCGDENNEKLYKPNPDIFRYTAKLLGEVPRDLYYVGDNPINDVQGAVAAGYVPVWVSARSPWSEGMDTYPEHVVRDIGELMSYI